MGDATQTFFTERQSNQVHEVNEARPKDRFFSYLIRVEKDLKAINRKTDSLLDWLGGWGGLLDGLNYIAKYLLSSYSFYNLNKTLA